jgi:hypothetical protein
MEQVELCRYQLVGLLGAGADYEVRAAVERDTGRQVVIKRPMPQMIRRDLHAGIEARSDRILQFYQDIGPSIVTLSPMLGYTERAHHDAYFGDTLGHPYRVLIAERALGIPLVGELKARFSGVPIGVGQNLFALFPLLQPASGSPFPIQQQLLDLQAACVQAGHLVLDLQPQNIFYQPASGRITVIDYGALVTPQQSADRGRKPPPDIHNFYLEMLKFYTTSHLPPLQAQGYREPYGLRPVVNVDQTLDHMRREFEDNADQRVQEAALTILSRVRQRTYVAYTDFQRDFTAYLQTVTDAFHAMPSPTAALQVWGEALGWLREAYWQRYRFHAETELASYTAGLQSSHCL